MEEALWSGDPAARAAAAALRLGHLRRRRLDARAHAQQRSPASCARRRCPGRASHLRAGDQGRGRRGGARLLGRRACATSWPCAAIRPRVSAPSTSPHPGGYTNAADLVAGLKQIAHFEVSVAGYPRSTPRARRSPPTSTTSRPRSTPAPTASSPSSASTTRTICAFSRRPARAASGRRSCPASCRSTTSSRLQASRGAAAPPCRRGWRAASTASTTIRRPRHLVAAAVATEQVMDLVDQGMQPVPFLHAEPCRPRLRHLPPAGPATACEHGPREPRRPSTHDPASNASPR